MIALAYVAVVENELAAEVISPAEMGTEENELAESHNVPAAVVSLPAEEIALVEWQNALAAEVISPPEMATPEMATPEISPGKWQNAPVVEVISPVELQNTPAVEANSPE